MTLSCGVFSALNSWTLSVAERFSMSINMMSVPSEREELLGYVPAGDCMAPDWVDPSRSEIRLLSDTRSVLEYLSNKS
jgi:hypothetical protein